MFIFFSLIIRIFSKGYDETVNHNVDNFTITVLGVVTVTPVQNWLKRRAILLSE